MIECKNCIYYYPEIGWCMDGEEGAPADGVKECEKKSKCFESTSTTNHIFLKGEEK